ncbi:hypothetical protein [Actinophytocola sp.]|uniref:hypothetical protein n=1 Tax=Actinophytocola sp. TaxID=1872138 RepID=UPI002ED33264
MSAHQEAPPVYSDVVATYTVRAKITAHFPLDVTHEDPDLVAGWLQEDAWLDVPGCPRCGATDPFRMLTSYTVNGITYQQDPETAHWVPTHPDPSTEATDATHQP